MVQAETTVRVRYAETDKMGFVYYGQYPTYYEVGRTEVMRKFGLTYKELEDQGILMPVLTMNIKYLKPAYYDDLLTIRTSVKEMPAAKIRFYYDIFRQDGELINQGQTELVFIKEDTQRPTRPPAYFLQHLQEYFS